MEDCQDKASKLIGQVEDAGSAIDDKHSSSSSSCADELVEALASDDDSQSSDDDDDEDGSIFVAEESYARLSDADEDSPGATSADLDDAFQCRAAASAATTVKADPIPSFDKQVPLDFEQELDDRIEAELAAKQSLQANAAKHLEASDVSRTPRSLVPMEVAVERSNKMSDEHIDQIKSIMAGIQLSDAAIPEWSRRVPEGSWMPRRRTVSSAHRPVVPDPGKASGSPIDSLASDQQSSH
ncbi:hypothetical protein IWW37_003665 [Coemansia sp. RSA 2050]|nr:hypothetical protein IWW37_003665 [Coemansia sp. RSA 2050]